MILSLSPLFIYTSLTLFFLILFSKSAADNPNEIGL